MEPITYSAQGDYLMPEILIREILPGNKTPDGRYARLRKGFLKEHRTAFYAELLLSEKLYKNLSDTQFAILCDQRGNGEGRADQARRHGHPAQ